jgi:hypothetical protein
MIDKNILLKTWVSHAIVYKWLHDRSAKALFKKKLYISIPLLVLNTVSGVVVYKADSFMEKKEKMLIFEFTVGTINMFCVLLTGLKDYFGFGEKSELHIQSFQNWTKFKNEIYVEMCVPSMKSSEFVNQMKVRYVDLISYGPSIPNEIIEIYKKKYQPDIDDSEVALPDIIRGSGLDLDDYKDFNITNSIDLDEASINV